MLSAREERTKQIKVEVEPRLHRRVKAYSAERGQSMTDYVTELLSEQVGLTPEAKPEKEEATRR